MTLVNLLGKWAGSAMGLNTDAVEKMVYPSLTGLGGHFGVIVSQIAGGWEPWGCWVILSAVRITG